METGPNEYIRRAIELVGYMKGLADAGEVQAPDSSCAVLFGIIRDCAYRIQGRAEQEEENHRALGIWSEERCDRRDPAARQEGEVAT